MPLKAQQFEKEIQTALRSYSRHIVCIEQVPDDAEDALRLLMGKAIRAFEGRETGMRHGIALNRLITVILSQSDTARPHCGIYFNLHSPYAKKPAAKVSPSGS